MLLFMLSLLPLVIGLYLLWRKDHLRRFQECADKVPGPTPLPFLGNVLEFGVFDKYFSANHLVWTAKKYGPIFRVWLGPKLAFVLQEPESVEFVLNSSKAQSKSNYYKLGKSVMGDGLLLNDGEIWKRHRRIIAPTFKGEILAHFVDAFNSNTDTLISQLRQYQNGPEFDVAPVISLYTLDIVCESAMGVKMNAMLQSESDYIKGALRGGELISNRMMKPWLYPDIIYNLTSAGREWIKCVSLIHGTVNKVIEERKQTRAAEEDEGTGHRKKTAFLDYLLQYKEKGAEITDQEIKDEVHNIMAAGHDTTSDCLSFTCWLLAKHPHIQEKAVAELRAIFGNSMRHATIEDLDEMKYIERIIKESLRIIPPVPLFGRTVSEDMDTGKYIFPAGCEIGINTYMLHRHPDYFPDPEAFDPDRFLPENSTNRHPYCYIPFGGGPRICLGYKYAFNEMKVAIAGLLRHFKILPPENPFQDLNLVIRVVLKSENGVHVRLEPRNFGSGH